jgi:cbb3-type cytochrome oxidase subunit 3
MNTINKTTGQDDVRIPVKMKLSALWAALMFLYIYADIFSLFRPGQMEEMMGGRMGPFPVTQGSLLTAAILMLVPALMVFLSLALKTRAARWANIILGLVYTAVNIGNLVGETWAYYLLFGIVELALTLLIAWYAWQWGKSEGQA